MVSNSLLLLKPKAMRNETGQQRRSPRSCSRSISQITSTHQQLQLREPSLNLPVPYEFSLLPFLLTLKQPNSEPPSGLLSVERNQADGDESWRREGEEEFGLNPRCSMQPSALEEKSEEGRGSQLVV